MRILNITSKVPGITNIILFSEILKDDYLYSSQLSIIEDVDDTEDVLMSLPYDDLPDSTIVTDRRCIFKTIFIEKGYI
jgi:hypothetical protein